MLARSIIILFLSIPASVAIIGVFLALTPTAPTKTLPSLLMFFPLWIGLACLCYLEERKGRIATILIAISVVGFATISLTKHLGVDGL